MLIHNSPTTYNNALRCMPFISPILKNETTEMLRNLPNITQPVTGRIWIQTSTVWLFWEEARK